MSANYKLSNTYQHIDFSYPQRMIIAKPLNVMRSSKSSHLSTKFSPPSAIYRFCHQNPAIKRVAESDREVFRKLGKTDAVVDALSHLPYIHDLNCHVAYATLPIQWKAERVKDCVEAGNKVLWEAFLDPPNENISPQVVSVTSGTRYGSWFLLDAEEGMWILPYLSALFCFAVLFLLSVPALVLLFKILHTSWKALLFAIQSGMSLN